MKRSLILILALGLLLLSGCTDKGNVSEDKDGRITDAPTTVKPTVLPTEGGANIPSADIPGSDSTTDSHSASSTDEPTDRDLGDLADDLLGDLTEAATDSARPHRNRTHHR